MLALVFSLKYHCAKYSHTEPLAWPLFNLLPYLKTCSCGFRFEWNWLLSLQTYPSVLKYMLLVYPSYIGKSEASAVGYCIHLHRPLISLEAMSHTQGRTSEARVIYHSGIYKHISVHTHTHTHRYTLCSLPASSRSPWTVLRHYSLSPQLPVV